MPRMRQRVPQERETPRMQPMWQGREQKMPQVQPTAQSRRLQECRRRTVLCRITDRNGLRASFT